MAIIVFQIWMFAHALLNREWIWAAFIFVGFGFTALWYYLAVYRATAASSVSGFELPGAHSRKRIRELQSQIHHIDNAAQHFELGDVFFEKGKLAEAEKCYRAALERDPKDIDARAHLGQCLVRLNRPAEGRPILENVMNEKPEHEYGYTMMALAEALGALGETDNAILYWEHVTQNHSYPRAKVQLAELYRRKKQPDLARAELKDVLSDDIHAPAFQRRRDRVWILRAKSLMRNL
ncbi:MAG: tetratricopeptide repeat protein [Limisphaerales bacterium]